MPEQPSSNLDLRDGIAILKRIAEGGVQRSPLPRVCATALLTEIKRLQKDLSVATTGLGAVIEAERRSGHETRASAVIEMYEHLAVGVEACPNCPTCQRNAEETLKAHRESAQKASAPLNCDCPNGSYGKKHRADCAQNGTVKP